MERRLQREQAEEERRWRQQQWAAQQDPIDMTQLFHLAGVQTDQPVLLPREVVSPVASAAAGRVFAPPAPEPHVITDDIADYYGLPSGTVGQPVELWRSLMSAPEPPQPEPRLVDLGRFDPTLSGIEVAASEVLQHLHRLRPEQNWRETPITQGMAEELGVPWLAGQPLAALSEVGTFVERQAGAEHRRADAAHRRLETDLLSKWGDLERGASLHALRTATARDQVALKRERQLVEPIVRQAIAEANIAERTVDDVVAKVRQDLQNAFLQGQLAEEELRRALQLTPLIVEEQRTDLEYLQRTLDDRVARVEQQRRMVETQIEQANVALEQAMVELAMSRRLGGYDEERARLEVERLQEQIRQLQLQNQALGYEATTLQSVNTNDPNALLRLYEADTKQFRDAGFWVPSFQDYIEFVRAGGGDWAAEVQSYNEAATAILGPARVDDRGMSAKDHMQLARAMYEARYWLGGRGTPTFNEFLRDEYWPSYQAMDRLLNPTASGTYTFNPEAEAAYILEVHNGDVSAAIRHLQENVDSIVSEGELNREQVMMIIETLRREQSSKGEGRPSVLKLLRDFFFRR